MVKYVEQNGVVDGVEGGREIQQNEGRHFNAVCCIQKIGGDLQKSRLCAVGGPVSRLKGLREVVRSEVFIDLGQFEFIKQFRDGGHI